MVALPSDAFSAAKWSESELLLMQHTLASWMACEPRTIGERRERAEWCTKLVAKWIEQVGKQREEGDTHAMILSHASLDSLKHYWIRTIHLWKFDGVQLDDIIKAVDTTLLFLQSALPLMPEASKQVDKSFTTLFTMLAYHTRERVAWTVAEDLLEQWLHQHQQLSSNEKPDLIVWTSFLTLAAKCTPFSSSGLARFEKHWHHMISMGTEPDEVAYAALLLAWARSGRKDAGQRVQALLEASEVARASSLCYNISIEAWGRSGEPDRGEEQLWKIMQIQQEQSTTSKAIDYSSFLAAIRGWSFSGRAEAIERAERLVDWMQKLHDTGHTNMKPDGHVYSAALLAWSKAGPEAGPKVERLLRRMTAATEIASLDSHGALLIDMYEIAIKAWAFTKDDESPARALALLDELRVMSSKEHLRSSLEVFFVRQCYQSVHDEAAPRQQRNWTFTATSNGRRRWGKALGQNIQYSHASIRATRTYDRGGVLAGRNEG